MTWNVVDLDGVDSTSLNDGVFDLVVDKCCLDCVLCETNGADYIAELSRLLGRDGVLCIVSLHGPNLLLPLLEAPELAFTVTHEKILSSTAVNAKSGLDLLKDMPVLASQGESTEICAWDENGEFSPPDDYIDYTNLYVCRRQGISDTPEKTAIEGTGGNNYTYAADAAQNQTQAAASRSNSIVSDQRGDTRVETRTAPPYIRTDKEALHARYDEILDDWFRKEAPMLTPARRKTIKAAFEEAVSKALHREYTNAARGVDDISKEVMKKEAGVVDVRDQCKERSTDADKVPIRSWGDVYHSTTSDAPSAEGKESIISDELSNLPNKVEQLYLSAPGKHIEALPERIQHPSASNGADGTTDSCSQTGVRTCNMSNTENDANVHNTWAAEIDATQIKIASEDNRHVLCMPAVYDVLFTPLEREHYDFEHFLEDYENFRHKDGYTASSIDTTAVVCACTMSEQTVPSSSQLRESDHTRGLNFHDAIAFLDIMQ